MVNFISVVAVSSGLPGSSAAVGSTVSVAGGLSVDVAISVAWSTTTGKEGDGSLPSWSGEQPAKATTADNINSGNKRQNFVIGRKS